MQPKFAAEGSILTNKGELLGNSLGTPERKVRLRLEGEVETRQEEEEEEEQRFQVVYGKSRIREVIGFCNYLC